MNHKRVHRVYREAGLSLRRKKRKHCVVGTAAAIVHGSEPGMGTGFCARCDRGRRAIRVLSVVDAFTRECLALEVDTSFASRRVTRVLDESSQWGGPRSIRCDNGPELTSRHFLAWCIEKKIELIHIQPGKPTRTLTSRASMDGCAKNA